MRLRQRPQFERSCVDFNDDLNACAALVERGDPHRFRTVMAAPVPVRARLFPLYAFNVEVSRAPWVTAEPMIAEMRLQWWRDALEEIAQGGNIRRHEVVTPLADILTPQQAQALDQICAARRWDCYKDPFEDDAHLHSYVQGTSGTLMQIAAEILGAADRSAAQIGYGAGVAAWLRAIPALEAQHRIPLLDGTPGGVRALAKQGLEVLQKARGSKLPKSARPALWPAIGAEKTLRAAMRTPSRVADGTLPAPGHLSLTLRAALGLG